MPRHKLNRVILTTLIALLSFYNAMSCSTYKITVNGKTMVGSNYDANYLTLRIWFENGTSAGNYGAVFTGGRIDEKNCIAPQSGMNEFALTFSRLAAPLSLKETLNNNNKKIITNPTNYLKDIIHKCKTIKEVKDYISQYDHSLFYGDVFIYVDKSGDYLIVEPDTMIIGKESKYVLSNFCPSVTEDFDKLKNGRYRKGVEFLKNKKDTSLSFYTALSDTMHECRKKIGDGTLLTFIRDLDNGIIYLNFYHDYKHQIKFNLKEELEKGDRIYEVSKLFPLNTEYQKLCAYKTPLNNKKLMVLMFFFAGLFLFSSFYFLISFFRRRNESYSYIKLILFPMGIILCYYMLILIKVENIFYFPAPYKDYKFSILNIASYIPFLILLIIIPFLITNRKVFKEKTWNTFTKLLFTLNNLSYLILIILFAYWGLYSIFN